MHVSPTNERRPAGWLRTHRLAADKLSCGVHQSSEVRFNPEELKTPSEDELAPVEPARNDEATNRWDADSETDARVASRKESSKERSETIITLYMREIGRVKLLTRQEEIELAARIKQGDGEARDQMIKANLRLVVKIARSYEGMGMPLLDLISEGNIGLMRAVERFDPGKGAKLSTYSSWWIKQRDHPWLWPINRRLPACRCTSWKSLAKCAGFLCDFRKNWTANPRMRNWRRSWEPPPPGSRECGWRSLNQSRSMPKRTAKARAVMPRSLRMKEPRHPCQKLENKTNRAMVRKIIDTLTRREQAVLYSRFGLNGHDPKNLEEVGKELNITDERVRQIQNAAFVKLRRRLKNFEQGLICEAGGKENIR